MFNFINKVFSLFKHNPNLKFNKLENKIISLHKKIYNLQKQLLQSNKILHEEDIFEDLKELGIQKEKTEEEFISLINQNYIYMGVCVNFQNFKDGLKTLLVRWEDISNHSLVLGTTRAGKTKMMLNIIKQNIAKGDNLLIVDPKNGKDLEVLNKVFEYANKYQRIQDIIYINPFSDGTNFFNPLFNMGDDEIASMISSILYPGEDSTSKFYAGHVETVLKSILYSLSYLERIADKDGELKKKLIREQMEIYRYTTLRYPVRRDTIREKEDDFNISEILFGKNEGKFDKTITVFNRSFLTFRDIYSYLDKKKIEALRDTVANFPADDEQSTELKNNIQMQVENFLAVPVEFHKKVSTSLENFISSLSSGKLGDMLCRVKINPIATRLHNHKRGTIIVMHPMPLLAQQVSEHLTKIFLKSIESIYANVSLTGRDVNPRRLYIHLDEGESALYKGVQSVLNKGAGLGQTMLIYTQSISDLESKLGITLAKVAKDSLNTLFVFKMNDNASKNEVVSMFGQRYMVESNVLYKDSGSATSFSNTQKDFITTSDIDNLKVGECLFMNKKGKYHLYCPFISGVDKDKPYITMPKNERELINEMMVIQDEEYQQENINKKARE